MNCPFNMSNVDTNPVWEKMFKEVLDEILKNCAFLTLEDYQELVKLSNKKENE